jgi:hypothetical protein
MAYVPGCRYDLFISYASENNRDGWVEQFQKILGQELRDLLGRQFPENSIFFDKREIEAAQSLPGVLEAAARESAILVPILSPSYLTSDWCTEERTQFFSQLPKGAQPAECLAPILHRPITDMGLNDLYRNVPQMSFLSNNGQTPLAVGSTDWGTRLVEFARQLKNALRRLRRNCTPVFVGKEAECAPSQKLRGWLQRELESQYLRTTPESLLELEDPAAIRTTLRDASLAIHFLGGADYATIEAIETSIAICDGPTILYQPFGVDLTPDEQLWLDDFERKLQPAGVRYQRLTGKNNQELLALIAELVSGKPDRDIAPVELALICEEVDMAGVQQLKDEIKTRSSVQVKFPDFLDGRLKPMQRARLRREFLSRSEAFLFYYGTAERYRLELIWQEAQQRRPDARRDWFLAPPDLDYKRQRYPAALWNIDQVVDFLDVERAGRAPA